MFVWRKFSMIYVKQNVLNKMYSLIECLSNGVFFCLQTRSCRNFNLKPQKLLLSGISSAFLWFSSISSFFSIFTESQKLSLYGRNLSQFSRNMTQVAGWNSSFTPDPHLKLEMRWQKCAQAVSEAWSPSVQFALLLRATLWAVGLSKTFDH